MGPLDRTETIILSVIIMTVVFAIVVMVLLMCRLQRECQIQRFTVQQTPPAHRRVDIIRLHPINCTRYSMP